MAYVNQLRKMSLANWSDSIFDLPVLLRGSLSQIHAHCRQQGWRWRADTSLYGGYYVDGDGVSYLIT